MRLGRRRRFASRIPALIGVPLSVVLIAIGMAVAVALSGMSIDASRWRDAAAIRASAALGRLVILQGAFELEPRLGRRTAPPRAQSPEPTLAAVEAYLLQPVLVSPRDAAPVRAPAPWAAAVAPASGE